MSVRAYFKLKEDHILIKILGWSKNEEPEFRVTTQEEIDDYLSSFGVEYLLFSSSMDFPDEYTTDNDLIELCNDLRAE